MEALAIDPGLDLANLMTREIPEGRQSLIDSHTNLERVAEYCQENYLQVSAIKLEKGSFVIFLIANQFFVAIRMIRWSSHSEKTFLVMNL
jgi:hypothetical protein